MENTTKGILAVVGALTVVGGGAWLYTSTEVAQVTGDAWDMEDVVARDKAKKNKADRQRRRDRKEKLRGKGKGKRKGKGGKAGRPERPKHIAKLSKEESESLPPGKWRRVNHLTERQLELIQELEEIGYADGTVELEPKDIITVHDKKRAGKGTNFYVSGHGPEATLMGMDGTVLHKWRKPFHEIFPDHPSKEGTPGTKHFRRGYVYPNGDMLGIFEGKAIVKLDKDSNVLWAHDNRAHHDLEVMPNGDVYVLTRQPHVVWWVDPEEPILEDSITVIKADGTIAKKVSLVEAWQKGGFRDVWDGKKKPGEADIHHTNTLEVLDGSLAATIPAFAKGNILSSSRALDALFVVDLEQEKVVWAMKGGWRHQHDPHVLDNGRLLLFDNQGRAWTSRVLEIDPVSSEVVWSFEGKAGSPFMSRTLGTAVRLANDNTLVVESEGGRAFEITRSGEVVWEFFNPNRAGDHGEYIAALFDVVRLPPRFDTSWANAEVAGNGTPAKGAGQ